MEKNKNKNFPEVSEARLFLKQVLINFKRQVTSRLYKLINSMKLLQWPQIILEYYYKPIRLIYVYMYILYTYIWIFNVYFYVRRKQMVSKQEILLDLVDENINIIVSNSYPSICLFQY